MAGKSPSSDKLRTNKAPLESMNVTNFRRFDKPHPMVECTVPGFSQEAFDRNWNPKTPSLMWVDALTRRYAVNRPLSAEEERSFTSTNQSDDDINTGKTKADTNISLTSQCSDRNHSETTSSSSAKNHRNTDIDCIRLNSVWSQEEKETAFLNWSRVTKELNGYGACCKFTMSRALYDPDVPKWTLDFRFTLGHVGACSIANTTAFYARGNDGTKVLLWTQKYQLVMVDKKTKQPARMPAWFIDKYQGRGCLEQGLIFRPFKTPGVTYCHPIRVQWSDTDEYGHANYSSYVKWATDALHAAFLSSNNDKSSSTNSYNTKATKHSKVTPTDLPINKIQHSQISDEARTISAGRALCGITRETVAQGLAKLQVSYYRECLEGDQLDVHVWQDRSVADPGLVWCTLVKQREDICEIKLWYFTDQ